MIIYKCDHCFSLFWYQEQLKKHIQQHFLEKKFIKSNYLNYTRYRMNVQTKHTLNLNRELTKQDKKSIRKFNKWLKELKSPKKETLR